MEQIPFVHHGDDLLPLSMPKAGSREPESFTGGENWDLGPLVAFFGARKSALIGVFFQSP